MTEGNELAGGQASWGGHGLANMVLGHLALATGEVDEAIGHLEHEVDLDVEQASASFYLAAFDLAEAYTRAKRTPEAIAVIERVAPHSNQAWARAALNRCRGLVASDDLFDEPSCAAVEAFARLHAPFEEARARLCRGERLRRARRSVEARDELRAALATFERLRAEPWAVRAHRELAAAGVTISRRTPSAVAELTPQELQVARIVAGGATNREAAARLFLSPKTIEAHLHRAYRKLGLTSRAQLRSILATRPTTREKSVTADHARDRTRGAGGRQQVIRKFGQRAATTQIWLSMPEPRPNPPTRRQSLDGARAASFPGPPLTRPQLMSSILDASSTCRLPHACTRCADEKHSLSIGVRLIVLALESGTAATVAARAPVEVDLVCRGGGALEPRIAYREAARCALTCKWLILGEALCVGSLEGLFKAMHGTESVLGCIEILVCRRCDRGVVFGVVARCLRADDEVPGVAACATGGGVRPFA